MTQEFVRQITTIAQAHGIPVVQGVVFIGVAQERANAFRSSKWKREGAGAPPVYASVGVGFGF